MNNVKRINNNNFFLSDQRAKIGPYTELSTNKNNI